jgi:[ribosomal protein S18]-alanine N-acetyltransferase
LLIVSGLFWVRCLMNAEIALRDYRTTDLDAMFQLDQECFSAEFRFDRESIQMFAEEQGAVVCIADNGGAEIVGFVIVHVERVAEGWRGYVVTLDVRAEYRGQGVARRLMEQAEVHVVAARARSMELHVFTGNEGAIRFYERVGYERIAVRRRFYGKLGLDAFVYRKELILV